MAVYWAPLSADPEMKQSASPLSLSLSQLTAVIHNKIQTHQKSQRTYLLLILFYWRRNSQVLGCVHVPAMTFLFHVGSRLTHPIHELCFYIPVSAGMISTIVSAVGLKEWKDRQR